MFGWRVSLIPTFFSISPWHISSRVYLFVEDIGYLLDVRYFHGGESHKYTCMLRLYEKKKGKMIEWGKAFVFL